MNLSVWWTKCNHFAYIHANLLNHTRDCFSPYKAFLNLQTHWSLRLLANPGGISMYISYSGLPWRIALFTSIYCKFQSRFVAKDNNPFVFIYQQCKCLQIIHHICLCIYLGHKPHLIPFSWPIYLIVHSENPFTIRWILTTWSFSVLLSQWSCFVFTYHYLMPQIRFWKW